MTVDEKTLRDLYEVQGLSQKQVGKKVGLSQSRVSQLFSLYLIPVRGQGSAGRSKVNRKVLRRILFEGSTTPEIARTMDVSPSYLRKIVRGDIP